MYEQPGMLSCVCNLRIMRRSAVLGQHSVCKFLTAIKAARVWDEGARKETSDP